MYVIHSMQELLSKAQYGLDWHAFFEAFDIEVAKITSFQVLEDEIDFTGITLILVHIQ